MKPRQPTTKDLFSSPVAFLGLGFGSGLAPKAPGTFGTLAAIPIYLLICGYAPSTYLAILLVVSIAGVWICGQTASQLDSHDHPAIVWDEIAGYLLTMAFIPVSVINVIVGFLLFRFFDILKPWPIRAIDRNVHGGFGIMLDDIIAGIFAWLILYSANYFQIL